MDGGHFYFRFCLFGIWILRKKKFSVIDLEKTQNQFINYSIYGKETELVKEFLEGVK